MNTPLQVEVKRAVGLEITALVAVRGRGPDPTRLFGWLFATRWASTADAIAWAARYLRQRLARPLPTFTYICLGADDRIYLLDVRWSPLHVHRVVGSWDAHEVHVTPRPDIDGFAIDLRVAGRTTPLHLTHSVDPDTRALLERLRPEASRGLDESP